jgi:hypothetical protein
MVPAAVGIAFAHVPTCPRAHVDKALLPVADNRRGIVCGDAEVNPIYVMGLKGYSSSRSDHRPADACTTLIRRHEDAREPTGEVGPDHADLDVPDRFICVILRAEIARPLGCWVLSR